MDTTFVNYAAKCCPAKHQRAFKTDLKTWFEKLPPSDSKKVSDLIQKGRANREKYWKPLAYEMLGLHLKKEGVPSTAG
jgi:hypothetical protein